MNLLAIRVCRRLRYNLYISISQTNRQYCNVANNKLKSEIFTDYEIIYTFPYVTYPFLLNKVKRSMTVGTALVYPLTWALGMSTVESLTILFINCLTTGLLHCVSYLCNNLVGAIYFKEDTQKLKISYINYWGKRIDLDTNVNNTIPLSETSQRWFLNIYRLLEIEGYNQKLKLYINHGKIHRQSDFYKLFGSTN